MSAMRRTPFLLPLWLSPLFIGCAGGAAPAKQVAPAPDRDVMAEWHAKADAIGGYTKDAYVRRMQLMHQTAAALSPEERRRLITRFPPNPPGAKPPGLVFIPDSLPPDESMLYDALVCKFAEDGATADLVSLLARRLEAQIGSGSVETHLALKVPDGILLLGPVFDGASGDGVRREVVVAVSRARADNRVRFDNATGAYRWPFPDQASERAYVMYYLDWYRANRTRLRLNLSYRHAELTGGLLAPFGSPLFVEDPAALQPGMAAPR
jgi:hypothetical protein